MLKYGFCCWFLIVLSYSIVVNLALVLYSSIMPVLIIVLCLVVLKACVPLFVFSYSCCPAWQLVVVL